MAEENSLAKQEPEFMEIVRKRYLEKNADVALQLIEERDKIKAALDKYEKWVKRLEEGDTTVFGDYKKKRKMLQELEDYDL